MKSKLEDICSYRKEKVLVSDLTPRNYISTENMLANKAGITTASALPSVAKVQKFLPGDVLVSNIRPYFKKIWFADKTGGCSNDVLVFSAKAGVNKKFLYYVLANDSFFDYSMATAKGTKMPRGDKAALLDYGVPDYENTEQNTISSFLFALDEKIQVNKQINKNLELQAQAYFLDLFVTNPDPNWQSGTLSDLGTVVGGGTPSKKHPEYYIETGIPWITPKDLSIDKSKFISRGENDITELGFSNSSATKMPAGTILFSSRAPIGYIAIALNTVTTNQGFKSVIPNTNVGSAFMYFFLKQALPTIEGMASGSTFKEISGSGMKSVPAVIPDDETLHKYNEFCQPLFEQQVILEAENRRLSGIRDALLPKLMSGEIDVSNIDL
jgi:type I restriction enzyme S subunit